MKTFELQAFPLAPYDYVILRHKGGTWLQMVHQGLVLEFTGETARITETIPGFDADKGGILLVGAPEGDDRRMELYCHPWIPVSTEQFGTMHLTLVDLHAVVAPCVVAELNDALLGFHRYLNHLMGAIDIAFQAVKGGGIVEADAAILFVAGLHVGYVEGRMPANLEVYLAGVCVMDVPDDSYFVVIEHVTHAEGEVVGIDFPGLIG